MSKTIARVWSPEVQDMGNQIAALPLSKAAELSRYLREVHKLEPKSNGGIVPPPPLPPPPPPLPTERTVQLDGFDPTKKISVLKVLREITGLGLREARDLVDGAPKPIKENLPTEEAEALARKLTEAGARVSLKP